VDAPLSWFHSGNYKSNSKEKPNSRFLHASYTKDKKDLLIGGWVGVGRDNGVGQLLVAARQTVQYSSALIMVYLLLNR
jgi:hypothetical protein